ncbi:AfsR/SARP family transcriptional regulator [Streptomyces chrestomyceticus]|uniref:AfsR/SARP family transcriptional regulator n=1 Tax=Streptomyces chrestomyceticus TaxID=68185 RepID=UPI0019D2FA82|nr:BTAD domain-containing putative transcriptional regulator [Streptomyces chrestomyceticus]
MDFRLLGPVSAFSGDVPVPIGPPKRRAVLALLVLAEGTPVGAERIIEALWDTRPPTHARTIVYGHVSALRGLLHADPSACVATGSGGYALQAAPEAVDVWRFRELVRRATAGSPGEEAAALLREALGLWRGRVLGGTGDTRLMTAAADRLVEERLAALEHFAGALHACGRGPEALVPLRTALERHPLRESLVAVTVRALHDADRQADAIDLYHRTQRLLAQELGVDPGAALSEAYLAILRSRPAVGRQPKTERDTPTLVPAPAPAPSAPDQPATPATLTTPAPTDTPPPPFLLPRAPAGFVGRADELARLSEAARSGTPALCVVTGPAGVGKTSLAVHWAYTYAGDYPGGILYADLHAMEPDGTGPQPAGVLHDFLQALGIPEERLPADARGAEQLYRSLLTGRRVLVLLDNARDSAQVRPLLPGTPGSTVLVTSRNRLEGLAATDCARLLPLERLAPPDGVQVLRTVIGEARVAAEPVAAAELSALCDGLPLALRLAAARLAARPRLSLRAMADDLVDEHRRLSLLSNEDLGVEATLCLSVQQLPPSGALLFRQLALHVGSELDSGAAAALSGLPPAEARAALDELAAAHLVEEWTGDRYLMHDLTRLYARSAVARADTAGLHRLLVHYLSAAQAAAAAAEPGSQPCCTLPPGVTPPAAPPVFAGRADAMAWYVTERANLTSAVAAAADAGHPELAWRIAVQLWPLVVRQVHDGWEPALERALAAATALDDPDAESRLCSLLGWVLTENGQHTAALEHLCRAPDLAVRAGDPRGQVIALINWAAALEHVGDLSGAGTRREMAARMAHALDHPHTESLSLYHLAAHCLTVGRPDEAITHCRQALALAPEEQSDERRALLLDTCGKALQALGRDGEARRCFSEAAALAGPPLPVEGAAAGQGGVALGGGGAPGGNLRVVAG